MSDALSDKELLKWKIVRVQSGDGTRYRPTRKYFGSFDRENDAKITCDRLNALEAQAQANAEIADAARKLCDNWCEYGASNGYAINLQTWERLQKLRETVRKHTTET